MVEDPSSHKTQDDYNKMNEADKSNYCIEKDVNQVSRTETFKDPNNPNFIYKSKNNDDLAFENKIKTLIDNKQKDIKETIIEIEKFNKLRFTEKHINDIITDIQNDLKNTTHLDNFNSNKVPKLIDVIDKDNLKLPDIKTWMINGIFVSEETLIPILKELGIKNINTDLIQFTDPNSGPIYIISDHAITDKYNELMKEHSQLVKELKNCANNIENTHLNTGGKRKTRKHRVRNTKHKRRSSKRGSSTKKRVQKTRR